MSNIASIRHSGTVSSIFLSDIHLGFPGCSADYLCEFLENTRCQQLYLVGDIIDLGFRTVPYPGEAAAGSRL